MAINAAAKDLIGTWTGSQVTALLTIAAVIDWITAARHGCKRIAACGYELARHIGEHLHGEIHYYLS